MIERCPVASENECRSLEKTLKTFENPILLTYMILSECQELDRLEQLHPVLSVFREQSQELDWEESLYEVSSYGTPGGIITSYRRGLENINLMVLHRSDLDSTLDLSLPYIESVQTGQVDRCFSHEVGEVHTSNYRPTYRFKQSAEVETNASFDALPKLNSKTLESAMAQSALSALDTTTTSLRAVQGHFTKAA